MHSGSVSTFNSSGMSLIHIPFASNNLGVLFLFKSNIQELQRLTNMTPLALQQCDDSVMWRSIPSVSFCAGWGFEGANAFLVFRSNTFISYISQMKKLPAQEVHVAIAVASFPVTSINLMMWSHQHSSDTVSKKLASRSLRMGGSTLLTLDVFVAKSLVLKL